MRALERLYIVIHNVHSVIRLVEAARIVYGMGIKNFVITRAIGAAAQEGVPEVYKLAIRCKGNLIFLKDLDDLVETLKPVKMYLFVPPQHAKEEFDPSKVIERLSEGNVMLVFGGAEPGLSKRDLERGTPVCLNTPGDVGTLGSLAICLYKLLEALKGS